VGLGSNLGLKLLAFVIAVFLWWVAHGTSSLERGYDLPVVFDGVPDELVITDQTTDGVNVRVLGSGAALRNLSDRGLEYVVDVAGAKPGEADFEVDMAQVEMALPRGARIVSRSPAQLGVTFEPRRSRPVPVRAAWDGTPARGHRVTGVEVEPARVKVTGARTEVERIREVVTETVDVNGLDRTTEKEVRVSASGDHVWVESPETVKVTVQVEAEPPPEPPPGTESGAAADAKEG